MILNICSNSTVLGIIYIIKTIVNLIKFIIPMLLILMVMLDFGKGVISGENEPSKIIKNSANKFLAAILIFLLPTIVDFSVNIIGENSGDHNLCWNKAEPQLIKEYQKFEEEERRKRREEERREMARRAEEERLAVELKEAEKKAEEEANKPQPDLSNPVPTTKSGSLTPIVNGTQRALQTGDCMSFSDKCYCPTNGKFEGFAFIMEDETGRSMAEISPKTMAKKVSVECSDGTVYTKYVHEKVVSNYEAALKQICKLQTTGINGIKIDKKYLQVNGTWVKRTNSARTICSPHSYATAIDINYSLVITVNGVDYKPYSGQGKKTKQNYDKFVEALGGVEDHRLNVNYILWKYAFKPNGFSWGGNWSDGAFDPMHYEISS